MSAGFDFSVVFSGAPFLKLCYSSFSGHHCMQSALCCRLQQSSPFSCPTVSMRLRPKRTCSGVKYFGVYHINRLFNLFLFLRNLLNQEFLD